MYKNTEIVGAEYQPYWYEGYVLVVDKVIEKVEYFGLSEITIKNNEGQIDYLTETAKTRTSSNAVYILPLVNTNMREVYNQLKELINIFFLYF